MGNIFCPGTLFTSADVKRVLQHSHEGGDRGEGEERRVVVHLPPPRHFSAQLRLAVMSLQVLLARLMLEGVRFLPDPTLGKYKPTQILQYVHTRCRKPQSRFYKVKSVKRRLGAFQLAIQMNIVFKRV